MGEMDEREGGREGEMERERERERERNRREVERGRDTDVQREVSLDAEFYPALEVRGAVVEV